MADLNVTAAQLLPGEDVPREVGVSGEAIAIGDWLYKKASDSRLYKADANGAAAETSDVVGQALSAASAAAQPVVYGRQGTITQGAGAAPVRGTVYVLSPNAGKAMPTADLASGSRVTVLGVGGASNDLKVQIHRSAVTV